GRRARPQRLRRGQGDPEAAPDVLGRGRELLREPSRRARLREPGVLRASGRRADLPRLRPDPGLALLGVPQETRGKEAGGAGLERFRFPLRPAPKPRSPADGTIEWAEW